MVHVLRCKQSDFSMISKWWFCCFSAKPSKSDSQVPQQSKEATKMDVTRLNFAELYPTIENEIKECDYLSFDCEFSGIGSQYLSLFDSPEERYSKRHRNEMKFDIVQFGLSVFKKPDANGQIECSCYNFYLLKRHVKNSILPDYQMTISTSAFEFLSINNFDFNLLFKYGIGYCTIEEEQRLKASLKRQDQEMLLHGHMDLGKQTIIRDALAKYNEFLTNSEQLTTVLGPFAKNTLNLVKATIDDAEKNRKQSPETNLGLRSNGLELSIRIICENQESNVWKLELVKQVCKESFEFDYDAIADETMGFSKVIQAIISHRKPIVGHNVLVDIMHIIHQFVAPLPPKYSDFQFITRELFPFIFDTKHMSVFLSSLNKQRVKSLQDLYDYFKSTYPSIINRIKLMNSSLSKLGESAPKDDEEAPTFHQAGYDSYITGVCFHLIRWLAEQSSKKPLCEDKRFRNKFYNAYSFDVPFLCSEPSEDVQLDRSNLFYFKFNCEPFEFENRLAEIFEDCKFDYGTDSESCLVGLIDKAAVEKIAELKKVDSSWTILSYAEYLKQKQANQRPAKKTKVESKVGKCADASDEPVKPNSNPVPSNVQASQVSVETPKPTFAVVNDW